MRIGGDMDVVRVQAVERMLLAPLQRMQHYYATLQRLLGATPSGTPMLSGRRAYLDVRSSEHASHHRDAGHPDKGPLQQTLAHFRTLVQPMNNAYARARTTVLKPKPNRKLISPSASTSSLALPFTLA